MRVTRGRRNSDYALMDYLLNNTGQPQKDTKLMPIDVYEREDSYEIYADVPGVPRENLSITRNGMELTIESCLKGTQVEEELAVHHRERYQGCYHRVVKLPKDASPEKITARLELGVLILRIPRKQEEQVTQVRID